MESPRGWTVIKPAANAAQQRDETMITFKTGSTYTCRSVCDYDCVWSYTIASRTAKTIKTTCGKSLRINAQLTAYNNAETVFPRGHYSMAPILRAK